MGAVGDDSERGAAYNAVNTVHIGIRAAGAGIGSRYSSQISTPDSLQTTYHTSALYLILCDIKPRKQTRAVR